MKLCALLALATGAAALAPLCIPPIEPPISPFNATQPCACPYPGCLQPANDGLGPECVVKPCFKFWYAKEDDPTSGVCYHMSFSREVAMLLSIFAGFTGAGYAYLQAWFAFCMLYAMTAVFVLFAVISARYAPPAPDEEQPGWVYRDFNAPPPEAPRRRIGCRLPRSPLFRFWAVAVLLYWVLQVVLIGSWAVLPPNGCLE